MEIHTPKRSIHTPRELLKEVGIIVLGVLIALAAEQAVEALHWHEQTALTQRELRDELTGDLNAAAEWIAVSDCVTARVDSLYTRLADGHGAWSASPQGEGPARLRLGSIPPAFRLPFRPYENGTWETARSSGALSHIRADVMQEYDLMFVDVSTLDHLQVERTALADQLQPLAVNQTLEGAERIGMEAELARLTGNVHDAALVSEQFIERARRHGISPDAALLATRYHGSAAVWGSCMLSPGEVAARARHSLSTRPVRPQRVPQM